ncbi:MAG: HK97 family phage prohead protease [Methylocystis sp.]|uniref:HK97 family phage prohead protease n=1 Tax=Methylocystis sp. TaxID=1911079 RepID=UPI003DA2B0FC
MNLCRRGAEVRASSFNEVDNTVDLVWTTGAIVRRQSWIDGPYDEELVVNSKSVRLDRLNAGAPFLNTHANWSLEDVIGSVVPGSARIEKGQGIATIKLSTAPRDADNVAKIRDGIIRNISVGYLTHAIEKIARGKGQVPLWRVIDWEPHEISAVPIPADTGAQIRSADYSYRSAPQTAADMIREAMATREAEQEAIIDRLLANAGGAHD